MDVEDQASTTPQRPRLPVCLTGRHAYVIGAHTATARKRMFQLTTTRGIT